MEENKLKYLNILFIILLIWTIVPLINGAFGVGDDFLFYKEYHLLDYWEESLLSAKDQGRFFQSFIMPVFFKMIPYCSGNLFVASAINFILFAIDFILLAYFVSQIVKDVYIKYLLLLLLIITINIHGHYSPLVSYPIYFSFSIMLILLSFIFLEKYQKNKISYFLFLSVSSYFFAILFCEMHLFYLGIIVLINNNYEVKFRLHTIRKNPNTLFVLSTILYVMVYITWRIIFSSNQYLGNKIEVNAGLGNILATIISFSKSSVPLYFYFLDKNMLEQNSYLVTGHVQNIAYTLFHAKIEWLIKGLIVAATAYFLLRRVKPVFYKKIIYVLLLSFGFIFIPNFLIAITPKYIEWGRWENYYVYTFYSYLAAIVFISMLIVLPLVGIRKVLWAQLYIGLITTLIFMISVLNDYVNFHSRISIAKSEKNIEAINEFIKTDAFQSLHENSIILAPDLFVRPSDVLYFTWDEKSLKEFVEIKSNKKIIFKDSIPENIQNPIYYLGYTNNNKLEEQAITFSKIESIKNDTVFVNEMILFVNSINKKYTIHLHKDSNSPLTINDSIVSVGRDITVNLEQKKKKDNMVPIKIMSDKIDIESFVFTSSQNNKGIRFGF